MRRSSYNNVVTSSLPVITVIIRPPRVARAARAVRAEYEGNVNISVTLSHSDRISANTSGHVTRSPPDHLANIISTMYLLWEENSILSSPGYLPSWAEWLMIVRATPPYLMMLLNCYWLWSESFTVGLCKYRAQYQLIKMSASTNIYPRLPGND